ncbi:hypothetical protein MBCUT_13820 [Methanobrevibacter cuticularis]|uniref:Uncharacterized protein n=1 Tax=Methanobrevibacter cuticularis TaxID=47311 RepID=A0A166DIN4_9EURY|nr:hypothetical protein [Methanobrevibacter cuticularis]KZX15642.1 hypothetical protein MBCUT_13820 [Methanobrevibacter cuticularis]
MAYYISVILKQVLDELFDFESIQIKIKKGSIKRTLYDNDQTTVTIMYNTLISFFNIVNEVGIGYFNTAIVIISK